MKTFLAKLLLFLIFFAIVNTTIAQTFDIAGPAGSGNFGNVYALSNGNYVVVDPNYDEGAIANVGAVYLYNGGTHTVISTLKGSTANNQVGLNGIVVLSNSNFIVQSWDWDNGAATDVGALTWVNGTTGLNAVVSSINSLIGSQLGDIDGSSVYELTNGNFIITTNYWRNGAVTAAGAVTWCNGATGRSGVIGSTISLVGTYNNNYLGGSIITLSNGNYVVSDPTWNGGFGAVVWCDGTTGRTGTITSGIALRGNAATHRVGSRIKALSNGNYVVSSPFWDNGAVSDVGAVTWCNGITGLTGLVSAANSLIGSIAGDQVGSADVSALNNNNYVVQSPFWDNAAIVDAGAATWCNGATGSVGTINNANSLVGSTANDNVGLEPAVGLSNGNYVVRSPNWDNGATVNAGAATWCNGATGTFGTLSSSNSLVGSSNNDRISSFGIVPLSNGNYVVQSHYWSNGAATEAGAATWGNGTTGTVGLVNSSNSLVGSSNTDWIGSRVTVLSNGNYVVSSEYWNNGSVVDAGAVCWGNGATGSSGTISSANSLVGTVTNDQVGLIMVPLSNGNYIANSYFWNNGGVTIAGAVTWFNGSTGLTGTINAANSLIGSSNTDAVGLESLPLTNGNYIIKSRLWDNGALSNSGAVTLCNGATGLTGVITNCNSVLGSVANGGTQLSFAFNYVYNYLIVGRAGENIVTIYDPTGMLLANTLDEQTVNIQGTNAVPIIANSGCRIIGVITASGASPMSGPVTAKIWIEPSVPTFGADPFVARHYEITPATNAATATGRVTLFFTQQEFTDFNDHPSSLLDLPTGPGDNIGISNLRIGKYGGTSTNGSGLPGTYPGTVEVINPLDVNIVWNNSLNRWEVSFDVTGFSGFIVQTKITVLPLTLLEFKGHLNNNNAVLTWKTSGEYNMHSFDIERSTDGRTFAHVGNVAALNQAGSNSYTYSDYNITVLGAPVVYYRIKQIDINGRFTYSGIVALTIDKSKSLVLFYPNPVITKAGLTVTINKAEHLVLKIFDNSGRLLQQQQLNLSAGSNVLPVNVKTLAKGVYYLELKGETINEHKSFVKQ